VFPQRPLAVLVLADGTIFRGHSIGAPVRSVGEVVFNTALSGYQEILTDPSYCRQIVTLTYPHIGNCGVNIEDDESGKIHAAGLIIKDLPLLHSNFRATRSLQQYLQDENIAGIAGIDTRKLTRLLRETGAQNGCLVAASEPGEPIDEAAALMAARGFAGLAGMDLAKVVSVDKPYRWGDGEWILGKGYAAAKPGRFKVVAYDFGAKRNILRMLADRGCDLTVVPAQTSAAQALALQPDGIFLSNGPGVIPSLANTRLPRPANSSIVACRPSAFAWVIRSWDSPRAHEP
jgi:carbamoyl-phosphate synthase small subunit